MNDSSVGGVSGLPEIQKGQTNTIAAIGSPVLPTDVDSYLRVQEGTERLARLREMLAVWRDQQQQERSLRSRYATALIWLFGVEIVVIFGVFFLVGFGVMVTDRWAAEVFLIGALAQTSSLILVIVRCLFPPRQLDLETLVRALAGTADERKPSE